MCATRFTDEVCKFDGGEFVRLLQEIYPPDGEQKRENRLAKPST